MTTVAYVDARAGVAGDMFLGALVDAGLPIARLHEVVEALGLEGVTVESERVMRGPLAAVKVHVLVGGHPPESDPGHHAGSSHANRTLESILEAVQGATTLPEQACADAVRTFERLAAAEAKVHGTTPGDVRFHEVGAADALVDVVGTCVGFHDLDVREVRVGPLPWSEGTVETAHGTLALPPPAVVHLLAGHPTFPSDEGREQVTPTGAALVSTLARGTTVPSGFVPRRVGMGAGTHPGHTIPNALRLVLGSDEDEGAPADAILLQANLDDATGQEVARAIEQALAEGALDAWAAPVTMKKGRPGHVLSVLVEPSDVARIEILLFAETPTLGVRRHGVARTTLARRHEAVETPWGPVRMKVRDAPLGETATPEHDDAMALADRHGVPLARVLDAARAAWAARRAEGLGWGGGREG